MTFALTKPSLFNENGSDSYDSQHILEGNPTGVANLNNQRYTWVRPLMREMLGNFWVPEKVGLDDDKPGFALLTDAEEFANRHTYSSLVFLDNYQIANLPNIAQYIKNPGVRNLLVVHEFQEVIHSESYQYGLMTFYPSTERDAIYNLWRESPELCARNKMIASIGEAFAKDPSPRNFMRVIAANIALEGIYFYSGFNFYDVLAHRNKLVQWNKIIDYIRKDEFTHLGIFINIVKEMGLTEQFKQIIMEVMEEATLNEIDWGKFAYGNRILGISERTTEEYPKYLCNDRLARLGMAPMWDSVKNPYQHILDSQMVGGSRANFFETVVNAYDTAASVEGWDDF